jgi:hypothetical protein
MGNPPGVDADLRHKQAQAAALAALRRGEDPDGVVAAVAPYDIPKSFTPDVAVLELAIDALDLACPAGADPLDYEGLREHYLPEIHFHGRTQHRNSQYALYAAACLRGGLRPDILRDAGWWHDRLWIYASYALIIYSRAAADRRSTTNEHIAELISKRRAAKDPLSLSTDEEQR